MSDFSQAEIDVRWAEEGEQGSLPVGSSFRPDARFATESDWYGFMFETKEPLVGSTREVVIFRAPPVAPLLEGAEFDVMAGNRVMGHGLIRSVRLHRF